MGDLIHMSNRKTGYLIFNKETKDFINPRTNLLYKTRETAEKALKNWPKLDGRVVKVSIHIIAERK